MILCFSIIDIVINVQLWFVIHFPEAIQHTCNKHCVIIDHMIVRGSHRVSADQSLTFRIK